MMEEPVINMDKFIKDFNEGMSSYNLQNKYLLTPRQYRKLVRGVRRKDGFSKKRSGTKINTIRSKFNEPYITSKKDGRFMIRKREIYYGQYDTLEIAKKVKQKLIENEWDKSKLNRIRKELGLKPMREQKCSKNC